MKIKCPRCGIKGEVVDNKCPICDLPLESNPTKSFNGKAYKVGILILVVLVAGFAYLYWNNHSSYEAEKVVIKKQADAEKEATAKKIKAQTEIPIGIGKADLQKPQNEINGSDTKKNAVNENNASTEVNINQLNTLKMEIEKKRLCADLFLEAYNISNEYVRIITIRHEIKKKSLAALKSAVINNMPQSYMIKIQEDEMIEQKPVVEKLSQLDNRRLQINTEKKINNCDAYVKK